MADFPGKCSVCEALIDEEDLFCANCGTEAPRGAEPNAVPQSQIATHNFQCAGCGASMSYDASAQDLRCPFCGSQRLAQQPDVKSLSPSLVVPFVIGRLEASALLRQWLGRGFWRPSDLAQAAEVAEIAAVHVPYWAFEARVHAYWTADSGDVPPGAQGRWRPVFGEHHGSYRGILIGASGVLTSGETAALLPFALNAAAPAAAAEPQNVIVEQFRVQRKYARPLAQQAIEDLESRACGECSTGTSRNLKVNVRLAGLSSQPVLLPLWIMAYRYRGRVFRFLINGQTGRATGQAPLSWPKRMGAIAIVALIALLLCLALLAARG